MEHQHLLYMGSQSSVVALSTVLIGMTTPCIEGYNLCSFGVTSFILLRINMWLIWYPMLYIPHLVILDHLAQTGVTFADPPVELRHTHPS